MTDAANSDRRSRQSHTVLLATDSKNSVFAEVLGGKPNSIAYSVYGKQSAPQEIAARLGFNGQLREARLGWYLLGNGYRAYNPVLMRFHSPDSWSPFGEGGLNAYMYCGGEPVMGTDPTGHFNPAKWWRNIRTFLTEARNRPALTYEILETRQSSETLTETISTPLAIPLPELAPRVNRDLKPAPIVHRNLKPPPPVQRALKPGNRVTGKESATRPFLPLPYKLENAVSVGRNGVEQVDLNAASNILRGSS
ncbi:RHS repeat-associated core domain-containing protein [Pseudomonas azerbaijanoccidentalis]